MTTFNLIKKELKATHGEDNVSLKIWSTTTPTLYVYIYNTQNTEEEIVKEVKAITKNTVLSNAKIFAWVKNYGKLRSSGRRHFGESRRIA